MSYSLSLDFTFFFTFDFLKRDSWFRSVFYADPFMSMRRFLAYIFNFLTALFTYHLSEIFNSSFDHQYDSSRVFHIRHRKKVNKNFRKFISQEQHIRILIGGACHYLK